MQQWAGELAVLRAEGRGSGLAGSGVEHSVQRRGGVEGRVSRVTRATLGSIPQMQCPFITGV